MIDVTDAYSTRKHSLPVTLYQVIIHTAVAALPGIIHTAAAVQRPVRSSAPPFVRVSAIACSTSLPSLHSLAVVVWLAQIALGVSDASLDRVATR